MIIDFTLANYGPFSDPVTLTFEAAKDTHLEPSYVRQFKFPNDKTLRLLRAAIIYGANAAGKTSILNALALLDALVNQGKSETSTPIDVNGFAFQPKANMKPTELTIRFVRDQKIFRYTVKVTRDAVHSESLEILKTPPSGKKYTPVFKREMGSSRDNVTIEFGAEIFHLTESQKDKLKAELQPNTTVLYTLNKKMTIENSEVKIAFEFFKNQLMGEVGPSTKLEKWVILQIEKKPQLSNYITQQLNSAGIPINNIQIEKKPLQSLKKISDAERREILLKIFEDQKMVFTEYEVNNSSYRLSLEQESLGTQRYFEVAGLLSVLCANLNEDQGNGRILPLDEMEHSLHPELIKHFWLTFLKDDGNSQIITTSHYREFLQDRTLFRDDVIWFVDKDHNTMSSGLYALEDVKTHAGLRETSSVYNYYVQGRLGGTPQLVES